MVFSRSRKLPVSALRSSWKNVVGICQGMPTTVNWTQPPQRSRPQSPAVTPQLFALPHFKGIFPRPPIRPAFSLVLQIGLALHCPAHHRPASPRPPQKGSQAAAGHSWEEQRELRRTSTAAPAQPHHLRTSPKHPRRDSTARSPPLPSSSEPNPRGLRPGARDGTGRTGHAEPRGGRKPDLESKRVPSGKEPR